MSTARVRQAGARVHLEINGRLADLPWQAALDLAAALTSTARLAESHAKAEPIIHDSAILLRAGVPFGLAPTRRHLAAAAREAAWNRDLRRYMPGGVRSTEAFGTPTILSRPPRNRP